jgi:hypothetical protein
VTDARETVRITVGYDGSDAARRGLARIQEFAARSIIVVIVAVAPDVSSPALVGEPFVGETFDPEGLRTRHGNCSERGTARGSRLERRRVIRPWCWWMLRVRSTLIS